MLCGVRGYGDLFEQLWEASQAAVDALKKRYEEMLVRAHVGDLATRS